MKSVYFLKQLYVQNIQYIAIRHCSEINLYNKKLSIPWPCEPKINRCLTYKVNRRMKSLCQNVTAKSPGKRGKIRLTYNGFVPSRRYWIRSIAKTVFAIHMFLNSLMVSNKIAHAISFMYYVKPISVHMQNTRNCYSFNKTEAAVYSCRLCFLRAFPFISLILLTTAGV